jgi:hypothetical protein
MAQLRTRRRVMWQGLVLFLFFGWSDIGRGGSEAHSDLCFAFLRLGNIVLHCTGDQQQVTKSRNIESFAVSDKPGTLGFVTTRAARQTSAPTATLVDLTNGNARNVLSDGTLLSTCGGLFDLLDRPHERSGTIDLVGGGTFAPPAFVYFRCSADRKVIAGAKEKGEADVYIQFLGETRRLGHWSPPYSLGISPAGAYVAYASDTSPLCVASTSGSVSCAPPDSTEAFHDLISVNDNGGALVAVHTREVCYYRSWSVFSPTKDLQGRDRDMCLGIGYWKAGMSSIEIIEPLGRNPQWVEGATAVSLRTWASGQ